jgi:ABC-type transport system substrate-binding protein
MGAGTLGMWFGWGNPLEPEPATALFTNYHSSGTSNFWGTNRPGGLAVDGLDAQLEQLLVTLDREERREIVFDIQRRATEVGCLGVMYYYNYLDQQLHWPYFHTNPPSPFYFGHLLRTEWLDQDDPSFQGRPA